MCLLALYIMYRIKNQLNRVGNPAERSGGSPSGVRQNNRGQLEPKMWYADEPERLVTMDRKLICSFLFFFFLSFFVLSRRQWVYPTVG